MASTLRRTAARLLPGQAGGRIRGEHMSSTEPAVVAEGAIDDRAARRNTWLLLAVTAALVAMGLVAGFVLARLKHPAQPAHRHAGHAALAIAVPLAIMLLVGGGTWLLMYRKASWRGVMQYGWRRRYRVTKILRTGRPLPAADLPVATALVSLMRRQGWVYYVFGGTGVFWLAGAIAAHGPDRLIRLGLASLYVLMLPYLMLQRRRMFANYDTQVAVRESAAAGGRADGPRADGPRAGRLTRPAPGDPVPGTTRPAAGSRLPRIATVNSRAGVVVTGTEVLTGRVSDRNGPWLAEQLRVLGVDISQIVVVGDRPADLRQALEFLAGSRVDLIITSGGLGPTADDLTAEVVAAVQGRPPVLDPELEARIAALVAGLSAGRGWRSDPVATAAATRKQAYVPVGAAVLAPVGTAPGLVVPVADGRSGPPVVVLPGPPRELRGMWPAAVADPTVQAALAARRELRQRTIRLWQTPESELAATLRDNEAGLAALEITTCLREGELEIVTRYRPAAQAAYDRLVAALRAAYPDTLFSADGASIDDIVAGALINQGLRIATAESCTGGLFAARLSDRPGSSAYLLGGLVAYANAAKHDLADVPSELIDRVGAVSAEVAEALATGARDRFGAEVGVGITGVAGPDGGSADKPVGLVHLCVAAPDRTVAHRIIVPGERSDVRSRAVVVAMHLVRQALAPGLTGLAPAG